MSPSPKTTEFKALLGILRKIQFFLEGNSPAPIMVASRTAEEFKQQKLPTHCTVTEREMQGPRIPIRKALGRRSDTLAKWPKDGMKEDISLTWYLVINGTADIRIWNYTVHCKEGDILFAPGRTPRLDGTRPHYEIVTPESVSGILTIRAKQLQGDTVSLKVYHSRGSECSRGSRGENCWLKNPLLCQTMLLLADTLVTHGHSKSTFHLFFGALLLIQQEIEEGKVLSSWNLPSESHQLKYFPPIKQAQNYMQNHLDRTLSIKQVAHWVGLSRTVFVRMFRQETGKTFHEYLTELRMEKAEEYLTESTFPVSRVSSFVGLSPNQLRNLFHLKHQCSPREFRSRKRYD